MPLSFRPACLPIAQNGLPNFYASRALKLLHRLTPAIFTWPGLPQRNFREHLYVQSASGFPGLVLDEASRRAYVVKEQAERNLDWVGLAYLQRNALVSALKPEDAAALTELLRSVGTAQEHTYRAIASQLIGPVSLNMQLTDEQNRPLMHDPMLREALAQHLSLRVSWLSERLNSLVEDTIICLDEPLLPVLSSPFCPIGWDSGIELLEQVFDGTTGCRGIILGEFGARQRDHDLATSWAYLMETSVELVALDVYNYSNLLLSAVSVLPDFLDRDGVIVWGLVPADSAALAHETADTLVARFEKLLGQLTATGLPREQVLHASLISTNDHLTHLAPGAAEQALQCCADISSRLRKIYNLA
jgi:hypothetical protein